MSEDFFHKCKLAWTLLNIEIFFQDLKKKIFLHIEMSILHFSQCICQIAPVISYSSRGYTKKFQV